MVACSGLRLCKGGGMRHPSALPSFIRWSVHTTRRCAVLRGAMQKPVLIPPELTDQLTKQFQGTAEGDKRVGHGL